jgi:hypothetical protein
MPQRWQYMIVGVYHATTDKYEYMCICITFTSVYFFPDMRLFPDSIRVYTIQRR